MITQKGSCEIGKFEMSVAFEQAAEDLSQRRIDALTAWLLAKWEAEEKEHDDARAAA
jgi:hypothetical protein